MCVFDWLNIYLLTIEFKSPPIISSTLRTLATTATGITYDFFEELSQFDLKSGDTRTEKSGSI
ncbi:hypothetical protein DICPUDRAFT_152441 [Dictyostelium purpureum]|uniref:Uncharacterized protein n=1 Tax=Dictyostelium purpureum TaxID=5786 RepID=F0ZLD3_DICPU|nr:uncharacterized protein DICPUDRAFT_152441 [Dictyostelium purpureum]EGC35238.1 hypothetical protein DICPUDRAFT_152441 [Dictyostelium purpureum]|eukprot:XP_003288225.1 hypothetical protein DICPUDRAFT_152441 [Dictyostelium purpureum]